MSDEPIREALRNAEVRDAQLDSALDLVDEFEKLLRKIGGYLEPAHQALLRRADALLIETGRRRSATSPEMERWLADPERSIARITNGARRYEPEPCRCDLRERAWNPHTGRCQTCGGKFHHAK